MIAALLIAGPSANLVNNSSELSAVHVCAAELVYNQTVQLKDEVLAPYKRIADGEMAI